MEVYFGDNLLQVLFLTLFMLSNNFGVFDSFAVMIIIIIILSFLSLLLLLLLVLSNAVLIQSSAKSLTRDQRQMKG